jgi:hypothetical protein
VPFKIEHTGAFELDTIADEPAAKLTAASPKMVSARNARHQ